MTTTRINTVDNHGKWAVVTESHGTSATYCISTFETKKEAQEAMNWEVERGNNAEVMLSSKAIRMYPDCVIQ